MTTREPDPPSRFDFDFRPDYWSPDDPRTVIVGNVPGEMRRQYLKTVIERDPQRASLINQYNGESHLPPDRLLARGFLHPWALGGEFLPEYLRGELEIARLVLESATMDVVSIWAHRRDGRIHYRVVTGSSYPLEST